MFGPKGNMLKRRPPKKAGCEILTALDSFMATLRAGEFATLVKAEAPSARESRMADFMVEEMIEKRDVERFGPRKGSRDSASSSCSRDRFSLQL